MKPSPTSVNPGSTDSSSMPKTRIATAQISWRTPSSASASTFDSISSSTPAALFSTSAAGDVLRYFTLGPM